MLAADLLPVDLTAVQGGQLRKQGLLAWLFHKPENLSRCWRACHMPLLKHLASKCAAESISDDMMTLRLIKIQSFVHGRQKLIYKDVVSHDSNLHVLNTDC